MKKRSIWASGNGRCQGFQRILGGQHHKGLSQAAGHAVHGNLPFLHGFQQGRLGTGRGTVDLVRQHKVGEELAGPELELTGLLVVEIDAGQIGGQQVGCELHPFEVPAHRARKCTQEHGFAGAGLILQQYMASAEEADQNFLGSILLAHNDAGTVGHNFFAVGGKSGSVHWCFLSQKQFLKCTLVWKGCQQKRRQSLPGGKFCLLRRIELVRGAGAA